MKAKLCKRSFSAKWARGQDQHWTRQLWDHYDIAMTRLWQRWCGYDVTMTWLWCNNDMAMTKRWCGYDDDVMKTMRDVATVMWKWCIITYQWQHYGSTKKKWVWSCDANMTVEGNNDSVMGSRWYGLGQFKGTKYEWTMRLRGLWQY